MRKILVSECLYSDQVFRFNGCVGRVYDPRFNKWRDEGRLIPICPEVFGGLPTPRPATRRVGDKILEVTGKDVTKEYDKGAREALRLAQKHNVICCIMHEMSPSCGSKFIRDETRKNIISGQGLAVEYLRKAGFKVLTEYELAEVEILLREKEEDCKY